MVHRIRTESQNRLSAVITRIPLLYKSLLYHVVVFLPPCRI